MDNLIFFNRLFVIAIIIFLTMTWVSLFLGSIIGAVFNAIFLFLYTLLYTRNINKLSSELE